MQALRDPLFLSAEFLNIREKDKQPVAISVRVNLQRDDLIYVRSVKSRIEVCGYVDPATGLFVTETEDDQGSVYHKFRMEAVRFAREELLKFLARLEELDEDGYKEKGYKPYAILANSLKNCLVDRHALYGDLQKQVNLIASRKFPKVNECLVFADEAEPKYPVTARLPYQNPETITVPPEEQQEVDRFLDVFFDKYNKFAFAWYMGAVLSNIPIYDDRISKLAILSASLGGSGKSTLVLAVVNALFTQHYRDIKDRFDGFFAVNNRFGTSALSTKRITVYSEADFNSDAQSEEHNFSGMNVSAIKSLVTEGYISSELKYGDLDMERMSGYHLVLTNHPPAVTQKDKAMNRRILPIMLRPTTMGDKARKLGLWGRQKLDAFVREHAQSFASYFLSVFRSDEYAFFEIDYNYRDYVRDIKDSQEDLDDAQKEGRRRLDVLKADGLLEFLAGIEKQEHLNLTMLKDDIQESLNGCVKAELADHIKLVEGMLYIDASKSFLLRYGAASSRIRARLKDFYGEPLKRYHKRMFAIPMAK